MVNARIIEITNSDEDTEYTFKAYEFTNGVILIPGESTSDWFFDSREDYQPNGTDSIVRINETDDSKQFSVEELTEIIRQSESEFGYSVGDKVKALTEKNQAAQALGRLGRAKNTAAQQAAAKSNGAKGGRPKKQP